MAVCKDTMCPLEMKIGTLALGSGEFNSACLENLRQLRAVRFT